MPNKRNNAGFLALMSAAAALPIVALPVRTEAQALQEEFIPAVLPTGAAIGARMLYYRESHGRMTVKEPVGWLKSPAGENWEFTASGTLDLVSGASTASVSNLSGRPVQILSGASITEHRTATEFSVKRKLGDNSVTLSRSQSQEKDYTSRAFGANATVDFNERNTTVALAYGSANDRIMSSDDPTLRERRDTREYLLGVTQLFDRNALVQSNLSYSRGNGYYNDPYRQTLSQYHDGLFPPLVLLHDTRPDSRDQWAWLTRYKRTLPEQKAVVSAEYRYFSDSWGIRAHTLSASWLQTINDTWKFETGLRYYTQRQADFYAAEITVRPTPRLTSSDQRLASFGALEPSIKLIFQLTPGTSIDAGISLYRQQGSWKLGGGAGAFEPLRATLVNAGFVHRF